MSFDWREYLSVAQAQASRAPTGPPAGVEANQRSAVSRAYYAAFILARNWPRDVDQLTHPRGGQAHEFVRSAFKNGSNPDRVRIGVALDRLRRARNRCDHEDSVPGLAPLTAISLDRAEEVLDDLRR